MKNYLIVPALAMILLIACKGKKDTKEEDKPISVLSIIKGQLNHLDTSLYQVTKFEEIGDKIDTAYLKREEIRKFAAPFLAIQDIADKKISDNYTEDKLIDAQQGTLNITSTLKGSADAEIQKQIVVVDISDPSNGKIQSIYIDRYLNSSDSTIQQKLFWEVDKYFSIGSIVEKEGQPDRTHTVKVVWQ
jgi:hypothetical protein